MKRKLMLALALASLALAARSDAGENLKLNPKLDYSGDSQDGPLITGDRMDNESYTRPEIAEYINANFVAVKLDYDARPRLTAKLERAHALKNFPAGIPLTGFLTPCGKLYLGGTYFPPQAADDKPGFAETLKQAVHLYREERAQVEQDGFDLKLKEEFGEEKAHAGAGGGSASACGKK